MLLRFFYLLLLFILSTQYSFGMLEDVELKTGRAPLLKVTYLSDKQHFFNRILLEEARKLGDPTDREVLKRSIENREAISRLLSSEKHKLLKSLAPREKIQDDNPLSYSVALTEDRLLPFRISERTEAMYDYGDLETYFTQSLDFNILAGTTFGMTTAVFSESGLTLYDHRAYGNTYYAVAYDEKRSLMFRASTSTSLIECIDAKTLDLVSQLKGYSATAFDLQTDKLYFAGYFIGNEDSTAIYEYNIDGRYIENMLTPAIFVNDVRGMVVRPTEIYFSETYKHRIIHFNRESRSVIRVISGFSFPNKLTLAKDKLHLFVADEHHDTVRKCRLTDFEEVWRLPFGLCTSPSTLIEISRGKFKGFYLIADTDNNRIILVDPNDDYKIIAEIRNLRSCMAIDIAFDWPSQNDQDISNKLQSTIDYIVSTYPHSPSATLPVEQQKVLLQKAKMIALSTRCDPDAGPILEAYNELFGKDIEISKKLQYVLSYIETTHKVKKVLDLSSIERERLFQTAKKLVLTSGLIPDTDAIKAAYKELYGEDL